MRILIIEEDIVFAEILSKVLLQEDYQVDVAENRGDAKYYLDIRNYDLVLLDWPQNKDSIDLIATIKTDAYKTSVIVLSERIDKESEIQALKSGADDFIRKPLDNDILVVRIEAKLRFGVSNIIEIDELIINPEEKKLFIKVKK
jgi:two-component system OmpR family response regulator